MELATLIPKTRVQPRPYQHRIVESTAAMVSYGWGMIPVAVRIGDTDWTTSLWPKDGRYIVPLKDKVRHAEGIELGDTVTVRLSVDV